MKLAARARAAYAEKTAAEDYKSAAALLKLLAAAGLLAGVPKYKGVKPLPVDATFYRINGRVVAQVDDLLFVAEDGGNPGLKVLLRAAEPGDTPYTVMAADTLLELGAALSEGGLTPYPLPIYALPVAHPDALLDGSALDVAGE